MAGTVWAIFYAGEITTKQAGTLFDVALGELLCLTHFAEAVTDNHGGLISHGYVTKQIPSLPPAIVQKRAVLLSPIPYPRGKLTLEDGFSSLTLRPSRVVLHYF